MPAPDAPCPDSPRLDKRNWGARDWDLQSTAGPSSDKRVEARLPDSRGRDVAEHWLAASPGVEEQAGSDSSEGPDDTLAQDDTPEQSDRLARSDCRERIWAAAGQSGARECWSAGQKLRPPVHRASGPPQRLQRVQSTPYFVLRSTSLSPAPSPRSECFSYCYRRRRRRCLRAPPTDPAVGHCCPWFAGHAPPRSAPEEQAAAPNW